MELDNSILHFKAAEVGFSNPDELMELTDNMIEIMRSHNGIGLAAPQVGIGLRVFVMEISPILWRCFNPRIIDRSQETTIMIEGCLSYPNEEYEIERSNWIIAGWKDGMGHNYGMRLDGLAARCFQHEMDHLDGITIRERKHVAAK